MPMTAQSRRQVRFSGYAFNLKTGELNRSGIRLRLEIQPAKVLCLLIEAEGNLVSRSELIAALWPGEVEGDFDRRLDKAVAKLRARLNDDPSKPRFIATLKGRGYRFLGEVTAEQADSPLRNEVPAVAALATIELFEERAEPDTLCVGASWNSPNGNREGLGRRNAGGSRDVPPCGFDISHNRQRTGRGLCSQLDCG